MYRTEEYKNKTTMGDYLENYVNVEEFLKCCEECSNFGKMWSCPPYDFNPEDYWKKHRYMYVIGTRIVFDKETIETVTEKEEMDQLMKDVFFKEKEILSKKMAALEKRYPGSISLSAGSCQICGQCPRPEGSPCLHPDTMRYSIESLGGNVGRTVSKLLGIELLWMDDKLPEYFTLVNGLLTDNANIEI